MECANSSNEQTGGMRCVGRLRARDTRREGRRAVLASVVARIRIADTIVERNHPPASAELIPRGQTWAVAEEQREGLMRGHSQKDRATTTQLISDILDGQW